MKEDLTAEKLLARAAVTAKLELSKLNKSTIPAQELLYYVAYSYIDRDYEVLTNFRITDKITEERKNLRSFIKDLLITQGFINYSIIADAMELCITEAVNYSKDEQREAITKVKLTNLFLLECYQTNQIRERIMLQEI